MSKDVNKDIKKLNIEVSYECWKKLAMLAIQNEMVLGKYVKHVLEKMMNRKKVEVEQPIEE